MKIYLGVTGNSWYLYLSQIQPEDINFWQPGGNANFKVLEPGAPFLFKLKSPINKIGGVGFFSSQTFLPISIAWDVFEQRNGCDSFERLKQMILQYRTDKENRNPTIGCIVLTNPVFFKKEDWLDVPIDWSGSIVQGKSFQAFAIKCSALAISAIPCKAPELWKLWDSAATQCYTLLFFFFEGFAILLYSSARVIQYCN